MLLACMLVLTTVCNAQYKVNKTIYNYRLYRPQVGDPYNPRYAGLESALVPGLGQMLAGEGRRGAAFLGSFAGAMVLFYVGSGISKADIDDGGDGSSGSALMLVGSSGVTVVYIWAIVDAVRVAKVSNMAFQSRNKTSLMVVPFIRTSEHNGIGIAQPGISIRVTF